MSIFKREYLRFACSTDLRLTLCELPLTSSDNIHKYINSTCFCKWGGEAFWISGKSFLSKCPGAGRKYHNFKRWEWTCMSKQFFWHFQFYRLIAFNSILRTCKCGSMWLYVSRRVSVELW